MAGRRRIFGLITVLITMAALLGTPEAHARARRHAPRTRRCHSDKQCPSAVCNDAHRCCLAGDFACGANCCNPTVTSLCCGDSACVDPSTDNGNCGACGVVCSGGKSCQLGDCVCPSGQTDCGGACKDLTSDPANCGACGNACGADFRCVDSQCVCQDSTDLPCNGHCVNPYTDRNNCNTCGNVCPSDQDCLSGQCRSACGPCEERVDNYCVLKEAGKDTVCNGVCVDVLTDPNNCGSCGNVCVGGDTCQNGICKGSACPDQWHSCGVTYPGGITHCCLNGDTCSIGERDAACCGEGTFTCANLDGYCCPVGYQCCGNHVGYPCVPPGAQCPQ